jgi:hypothetical protein
MPDILSLQHLSHHLCVHHELHEYDQDEDSSKACVPRVLLSHDAFTFRKVLVAMERLGALFLRTDIWLVLGWLFCLEEWSAHCRLPIN